MSWLARIVESPVSERAILGLIVLNAVILGLETSPTVMASYKGALHLADQILLWIFVVELAARLLVMRLAFFKDPWSLFDAFVIGIALLPATGSLTVLRALRVLRVLRLISAMPSLRRVVAGLIGAMPGMGSIALLTFLLLYVFSVMGTKLFAADSPEQFGNLARTAFTLFQVMTFDDWVGSVLKPLTPNHPYAVAFFIIFILLAVFMMLNLFIGVVVTALDDEKPQATSVLLHDAGESAAILAELREIRAKLEALERSRIS